MRLPLIELIHQSLIYVDSRYLVTALCEDDRHGEPDIPHAGHTDFFIHHYENSPPASWSMLPDPAKAKDSWV